MYGTALDRLAHTGLSALAEYLRRMAIAFSAYSAEIGVASAENMAHNLRRKCGDYADLHPSA